MGAYDNSQLFISTCAGFTQDRFSRQKQCVDNQMKQFYLQQQLPNTEMISRLSEHTEAYLHWSIQNADGENSAQFTSTTISKASLDIVFSLHFQLLIACYCIDREFQRKTCRIQNQIMFGVHAPEFNFCVGPNASITSSCSTVIQFGCLQNINKSSVQYDHQQQI